MPYKKAGLILLFTNLSVMEQKNPKQSRSRRSKVQMLELLKEFDNDKATTVNAFCALHQISKASFYSARSRYRREDQPKPKPAGFIALGSPAFKEPTPSLFAEVKGIKLYQHVSADYLKALIV